MNQTFLTTVRFDRTQGNGQIKKVTENYIVEAVSYKEAEERITTYMQPYLNGDFEIKQIKQVAYNEILESDDAEYWWESRINIITIDEKTTKEKKTKIKLLVSADNLHDAMKNTQEKMKDSMSDYTEISIRQTNITDVYFYEKNQERDNSDRP